MQIPNRQYFKRLNHNRFFSFVLLKDISTVYPKNYWYILADFHKSNKQFIDKVWRVNLKNWGVNNLDKMSENTSIHLNIFVDIYF